MAKTLLFIVLFALLGLGCHGETCIIDGGYEYCQSGCCDNACCTWTTVAIVGTVIGGIMALLSIVFCVVCIYCCWKKHKGGSNVQPYHSQPYQNTNSVYINNNPYGHGGAHGGASGGYPPSYTQSSRYPGYDPAYPPGTTHPPPAYTYNDSSKK